MNFQPAIKWSGSKRSQCNEIISYFPRKIETYYESFLGGGSVAYRLMNSDIKVNKFVLSDLNSDLINLYKLIQIDYKSIINHYEILWNELNKDSDFERKKLYFTDIRKRLNEKHDDVVWFIKDVDGFELNFRIAKSNGKADKVIDLFLDFYESKKSN